MKKLLQYYVLLLTAATILPSQAQQLRFNHYTMQDGLSHPGTFFRESIIQDSEGFLWISTLNGLNRFDGRTFKVFQFDEADATSLNSNLITGLCEAEDGKIWVGTSTGINIFHPRKEVFELIQHDPADPGSLCGNGVNFIRKDRDGNMWVGTQHNGVCRYAIKTKTFDNFGGFFEHGLVFFQQENGTIWIGNHDGLFRYLPETNSFQTIQLPIVTNDPRVQPASDICELNSGNLLITSTFSGLWEFNPDKLSFTDISQGFDAHDIRSPSCILCDESGRAWMGGVGELFQYDPATGVFTGFRHDADDPASLPIPTIIDAYQDAAGSLWLHVIGIGLTVAHTLDNPFKTIANFGMSEALHLDDEHVLMNTGQGLKLFDIHAEQFVEKDIPSSFPNMRGRSLVLSADKETLFVRNPMTDEIHSYYLKTQERRLLPVKGWLKSDLNNRPWVKLKYLDPIENKWINLEPELSAAYPELIGDPLFGDEAYFNDKSSVWWRTGKGVFHYNLKTQKGEHHYYYPNDSTAIVETHFIYPGSAGRFYCYHANGLSMFNPGKNGFEHFGEKDGLLHNQAHAIVEDADGNLWIGSPKGLQKLDLQTGTFTNYGISDGLQSNIILQQWPFLDNLGFLYFSIAGKLIRFHPDSIRPKEYAPPIHLLDFYLNHEVANSGEDSILSRQLRYCNKIDLTYKQSDFGFSFVMPVFYKAEEVAYFYQLAPYEKKWQSAAVNTEVHYTNIDPGSYTFRVKAKTAAGFRSPNEASVKIVMSPPWWQTVWAYLAYAILFFGGVFSIYRFNLNRQLEKAEANRLQELDTLKSQLYTNITHEFRTPLTVIMGMSDNIRGHQNEKNLISRNSKNLLRLINQLLDLSKLDSGTMKMDSIQADIINYLQYLTESFYSMAEEKKIRLMFYAEVRELVMDFDEVKIQHIIYNLLSNAIKFSRPGDKVVLHAAKLETNGRADLQLKVSDTGIGISKEDLEHIFDRFYQSDATTTRKSEGSGIGLALTKDLVEVMGGKISVESQLSEGTEFFILLPITRNPNTPPIETDLAPSRKLERELVPDPLASTFQESPSIQGKPQLLIIEDNKDVTTYMSNLLKLDYQITVAENGDEGIEIALESIPDIIISDVMMPEKDGFEVCQILKNDERTSHIPVILLTAKATIEDRLEGLGGGADAYLTKPFNKEELFIRLEQLIALRKKLQERFAFYKKIGTRKPGIEEAFLQKLIKVVEDRLDDPDLGVKDLCDAAHLSNMQVNRKLKALTGKTPSRFIRSIRLQHAMELLTTTELNVSEIAYEVGFSDPNYFSRSFSEEFGHPPSVRRKEF